jgi:large subunit ribosomal protein L35
MLASGKIKRAKAFKRHLLTKKTTKNKRQLRGTAYVGPADIRAIRLLLPNG